MTNLDMAAIGRRISAYRKLNGWTAADLAAHASSEDVSLSREMLAKIESGKRADIGLQQLLAIAWAMRIPPAALLYDLDPNGPGATLADWFAGWPATGLGKVDGITEAGRDGARRMLWLANLGRRIRRVESLESNLALYAAEGPQSSFARTLTELEEARADLAETRAVLEQNPSRG